MQPERQRRLQIYINAKAKTFRFTFKAIAFLPHSASKLIFPFPFKLNLKLKLCPSLLQFKKSKPQPHFLTPKTGKSWKSKFLRVLRKIRPGPTKNKAITASDESSNLGRSDAHFLSTQLRHFSSEESMWMSSISVGFIALLSQIISQNNKKGVVLCTLIIFLCIALMLKKYFLRRTSNLIIISIVAIICWAIWVNLRNILKIDYFWRSCMDVCSSLGQVLHSSFSQYIRQITRAERCDNYASYSTV